MKEYLLQIKDANGDYNTYLPSCNGADPTIVANRYCYVEMSVLRSSSLFNLAKSDKIIMRAMASNIKGFNVSFSPANPDDFNTVIETEPDAPAQPFKGADTKYNVLHTYWTTIPDFTLPSGGVTAAILSYHLQRNEGNNTDTETNTDTWTDLNGLSPASLISDF